MDMNNIKQTTYYLFNGKSGLSKLLYITIIPFLYTWLNLKEKEILLPFDYLLLIGGILFILIIFSYLIHITYEILGLNNIIR